MKYISSSLFTTPQYISFISTSIIISLYCIELDIGNVVASAFCNVETTSNLNPTTCGITILFKYVCSLFINIAFVDIMCV